MYSFKIKPVLTEKSLKEAKNGHYTFFVDFHLSKEQIKPLIEKTFGVHVKNMKTMNYKREERKNYKGVKQIKKALKKVMVGIGEKEKIDIFEEKSK